MACLASARPAVRAGRSAGAPRPAASFARTARRPASLAPRASSSASSDRDWYAPSSASADDLLELLRQRRQAAAAPPERVDASHSQQQAAAAAPQQQQQQERQPQLGVVHLVGTGPGDPGLLTMRAVQLMRSADVVLYDRLVSEDILSLIHPGALLVYVGKQRGFHTRTQPEIHDLLLAFAGQGATVLRLKGGDPYVFGRGGEEAQYLEERGVAVRVVPGITAASGISAELGIPLTHRGLATSVRFLTGHSREGGESQLDDTVGTSGADPHTTLVVYMGLGTLPTLARQLADAGLPADMPAVAVERGTTPQQRAVWAPLGGLQDRVGAAGLVSPTLIVIGQVVSLAPGWRRYVETGVSLDPAPGASSGGSGGGTSVGPDLAGLAAALDASSSGSGSRQAAPRS